MSFLRLDSAVRQPVSFTSQTRCIPRQWAHWSDCHSADVPSYLQALERRYRTRAWRTREHSWKIAQPIFFARLVFLGRHRVYWSQSCRNWIDHAFHPLSHVSGLFSLVPNCALPNESCHLRVNALCRNDCRARYNRPAVTSAAYRGYRVDALDRGRSLMVEAHPDRSTTAACYPRCRSGGA